MLPPDTLHVVYRDDWLVAVDKPPALLVHRTALDRHETRFAVQLLRGQLGRRVYPVHRLDKPTSGLLLFALDPATARHLAQQFEAQTVAKAYLAVVRGWSPEQTVVDHALAEPVDTHDAPERPARPARTCLRTLATVELPDAVDRYPTSRYSLVALYPRSGRRHQLRRHMKHIAHPIVGDTRYGKGTHNRFFRERYGCERLLLACVGLAFEHPADPTKVVRLTQAPGDSFAAVLQALRWHDLKIPFPVADT